jgi:hypothetical protein
LQVARSGLKNPILGFEWLLLSVWQDTFATAAKVRFPPSVTMIAYDPKLPFATISNPAKQYVKADIDALSQHD